MIKGLYIPVEERFWKYVSPEPMSGCWLWTGSCNNHGYGQLGSRSKSNPEKKSMVLAHRVSWEISKGKIQDSIFVLHKCDNPLCVNPDHLFTGTQTDNLRDMVSKGRHWRTKKRIERMKS